MTADRCRDGTGARIDVIGEDRCPCLRSVDSRMRFQITVRYGVHHQRYHTFIVEAADAAVGLRTAAEQLPPEIADETDLVELRVAVEPDDRRYLGEDGVG